MSAIHIDRLIPGSHEAPSAGNAISSRATILGENKNLHSAASTDTESLSTRGRSVWVHSSQVGLIDNSMPNKSLPESRGRRSRASRG